MKLTDGIIKSIKEMIIMSDGKCILSLTDKDEIILTYFNRGLILVGPNSGVFVYESKLQATSTNTTVQGLLKEIKEEYIEPMIDTYKGFIITLGYVPSYSNLLNTKNRFEDLGNLKKIQSAVIDDVFASASNLMDRKLEPNDKVYTIRLEVISNKMLLSMVNKDEKVVFLKGNCTHDDIVIDNINISMFKPLLFKLLYSFKVSRDLIYYPGDREDVSHSEVVKRIADAEPGTSYITLNGNIDEDTEELYYAVIDGIIHIYRLDNDLYILCHAITPGIDKIIYRTLSTDIPLPKLYIGNINSDIAEGILNFIPRHKYGNRRYDIPRHLLKEKLLPLYLANIKTLKGEKYEKAIERFETRLPKELKEKFTNLKGK